MLAVLKTPKSLLFRAFSLAAALVLAGCETFREPADSDTFIFLDEGETLFVRFSNSTDIRLEQVMPGVAESVKDRRREQFYGSMRKLAQAYRFPMDLHLLEEMEEPGDGPVLDLFAIRWEQDTMGEITAVVRARLEKYGELNTLGTFREREMPSLLGTYERTEQVFATTMEDALSKVFIELDKHFETVAEEAFVEAPLAE